MSAIAGKDMAGNRRTGTVVAVAVVAAVVAFVAGPVLFTPSTDLPAPSGTQLPWFVALAAIEAVVFGAGVAFAAFGRGVVARIVTTPGRVTAIHLAITWALVSWWPHDGLHMVSGLSIDGLLAIEYGFHVTMMVAAAVVVAALLRQAADRRA